MFIIRKTGIIVFCLGKKKDCFRLTKDVVTGKEKPFGLFLKEARGSRELTRFFYSYGRHLPRI